MNFSTSVLLGLLLASAADAALRTNLYLGRKPQNGMLYPLNMTFGPNSFLLKALKRIKEQDRTLKIENGDQQQEIQGENPHDASSKDMSIASSKSKPSLYSLPEIKYVLLDQQGKEFKLNADSRNIATRVFTLLEDCMARNDLKNARALLEKIFELLSKKGLTLHVGIDGNPMLPVIKNELIKDLDTLESSASLQNLIEDRPVSVVKQKLSQRSIEQSTRDHTNFDDNDYLDELAVLVVGKFEHMLQNIDDQTEQNEEHQLLTQDAPRSNQLMIENSGSGNDAEAGEDRFDLSRDLVFKNDEDHIAPNEDIESIDQGDGKVSGIESINHEEEKEHDKNDVIPASEVIDTVTVIEPQSVNVKDPKRTFASVLRAAVQQPKAVPASSSNESSNISQSNQNDSNISYRDVLRKSLVEVPAFAKVVTEAQLQRNQARTAQDKTRNAKYDKSFRAKNSLNRTSKKDRKYGKSFKAEKSQSKTSKNYRKPQDNSKANVVAGKPNIVQSSVNTAAKTAKVSPKTLVKVINAIKPGNMFQSLVMESSSESEIEHESDAEIVDVDVDKENKPEGNLVVSDVVNNDKPATQEEMKNKRKNNNRRRQKKKKQIEAEENIKENEENIPFGTNDEIPASADKEVDTEAEDIDSEESKINTPDEKESIADADPHDEESDKEEIVSVLTEDESDHESVVSIGSDITVPERKRAKPVGGNPVPVKPSNNQTVNNETAAAASSILTEPPKSEFSWMTLVFSVGGLVLVSAAIATAVYFAMQTDQDEEIVEL